MRLAIGGLTVLRPGFVSIVTTAFVVVCVSGVQAEVVIGTVTVGSAGNAGELSGDCVPERCDMPRPHFPG